MVSIVYLAISMGAGDGLGIDAAKALSDDTNPKLTATLVATAEMTRSMIWELRHPISMGGIYEGLGLSRALWSHVRSFTNVTSSARRIDADGKSSLIFRLRTGAFSFRSRTMPSPTPTGMRRQAGYR